MNDMNAKEFLKSKGINEIKRIIDGKGDNTYNVTPEQMEEFAQQEVEKERSKLSQIKEKHKEVIGLIDHSCISNDRLHIQTTQGTVEAQLGDFNELIKDLLNALHDEV